MRTSYESIVPPAVILILLAQGSGGKPWIKTDSGNSTIEVVKHFAGSHDVILHSGSAGKEASRVRQHDHYVTFSNT